jgi:DNA helicase HerA-like ATPase
VKITMGVDSAYIKKGERRPVVWDSAKLINGHVLIVGKSGTGKTYTLKKMLNQLSEESNGRFRCHVMDVHGDIDIEGASTVKFSEATPYGFNPLSINPDPDFGGVRKRIQSFIGALSRTGYKLGSKQEAALRNILYDLYAANGFYDGDPKSWKIDDGISRRYPKKHPGMEDAVKFANAKLRGMFLGTSSKTVSALEKLYRKQNQFYIKTKQANKAAHNVSDLEGLKADLEKLAGECTELFSEHLASVQTGMELPDLIKYDSKDVMKSVVDRLENLNSIGIFRPERPPFDPANPIWRYDIRALAQDEKKLFVSFILEAIFLRAVQRGIQSDLVEVIVLDEAHLFLNDDPENPINIIAKEARKFGVGLFAASQSPTHFSDDFIANVSTKIILGIDQMYWDGTVRKLKLDMKALDWIVPTRSLIMQMNNRGQTKNDWLWVALQ